MNTFNTALYLRLSRDDGTEKESGSIQNQRSFLTQYAAENGFNIIDIYSDDGWSGTNFDRPGFLRMLSDIESGRINCIITKDLSRLGRDYIMTGHYLERYFPQHNVRYIAVNDGIDTYNENTVSDMTPFKAVFNDMYAKDISKKVRTALNVKKKNGIFIGSSPPYGYNKDPADKGRLIIDPETAVIVKQIFSMYLSGYAKSMIAEKLSLDHIPTPSVNRNSKSDQKKNKCAWNPVTVNRILTNPTYIGNLTQNRSVKINYKLQKKKELPPEQWIIAENTHEPIISKEIFRDVQELINKRKRIKTYQTTHLLSGILKCGGCGGKMTFSHSGERIYAICSAWKNDHSKCTPHRIREDRLEKAVTDQLRTHAKKYIDKHKIAESINSLNIDLFNTGNILDKFLDFEYVDSNTISLLIKKIDICDATHINIHFNFRI